MQFGPIKTRPMGISRALAFDTVARREMYHPLAVAIYSSFLIVRVDRINMDSAAIAAAAADDDDDDDVIVAILLKLEGVLIY